MNSVWIGVVISLCAGVAFIAGAILAMWAITTRIARSHGVPYGIAQIKLNKLMEAKRTSQMEGNKHE